MNSSQSSSRRKSIFLKETCEEIFLQNPFSRLLPKIIDLPQSKNVLSNFPTKLEDILNLSFFEEIESSSEDFVKQLSVAYELARNCFVLGYLEPAKNIALKILELQSGFILANTLLGFLELEEDNFEYSIKYFRLGIKDETYKTTAKLGLFIAFMNLKEFDRAGSLFEEIKLESDTLQADAKKMYNLFATSQNLSENS